MFTLTAKQDEAQELLRSTAQHIMLFGGSRSGKSFLLVRAIIIRALLAPKSRHAIFRFRLNAIRQSIGYDTFPSVMALCFPTVQYEFNKTELIITFPNGSQIYLLGCDDKERVDKILGLEFSTIFFNECSQIPYHSICTVLTRLAQAVVTIAGHILPTRAYYDCNPANKLHWSYALFIAKHDPATKITLANPQSYASIKINPIDNQDNIASSYFDTLNGLSSSMRHRFLDGDFAEVNEDAIFNSVTIDTWRVTSGEIPQLVRVVVGVDPSGSGDIDNAKNDAIGIVVAGLGVDGNIYVLEDLTVKAGPSTWGRVVVDAYARHRADVVVGEQNYGGEMCRFVVKTADPDCYYKPVTATRGKQVRAEPFSALYEQGKIRHVGRFNTLEDELCGFSNYGYTGDRSPNSADAAIWAFSELFPGVMRQAPDKEIHKTVVASTYNHAQQSNIGWLS